MEKAANGAVFNAVKLYQGHITKQFKDTAMSVINLSAAICPQQKTATSVKRRILSVIYRVTRLGHQTKDAAKLRRNDWVTK
jgi:hypothetical protein